MTAARYPHAAWKPLGDPSDEPSMKGHGVACVHTMVGYLSSTDAFFRVANGKGFSGTESHFGVGGPWGTDAVRGLDGTVWQWQDLLYTADANLDGNPWVISIETADNAPRLAADIKEWSPAQCDSLVSLLLWVTSKEAHAGCPSSWECHASGIPRVLIPDTAPGRRGIGYHRQGIPPWMRAGAVKWSAVTGKPCPGDERVDQLKSTIIPRVQGADAARVVDVKPVVQPPKAVGERTPRVLGVVKAGMTGPLVKQWQGAAGTTRDGIFGAGTAAAVKVLQKRLDVAADGMAGPGTLRAYLGEEGQLSRGDHGYAVGFVQVLGGVGVDNDFGPLTVTAVKEMQRWADLTADGVVGPATRAKIVR
jgi:peptidoglycan hydrolase-like protein with peptidoglycan-binding domain